VVAVVIPVFEPDGRLVALVDELRLAAPDVPLVVVDDGSGPRYSEVFGAAAAAGATLLRHEENRGKGAALKTGFALVEEHLPGHDVVCADSDGQHTVVDVLRVAEVVAARGVTVLGGRRFTGTVPARSRVGNAGARLLVRLVTGLDLHDTQTGLRGYPAALLPWLRQVRGERFEYEQRLLLEAGPAGHDVTEIEIATVYLDHNASSHFRPVADSVRVLSPVLTFLASSFAAFVVDTVALLLLSAATGSLLAAVLGARALSGAVNLLVNRHVTFRPGRGAPLGRVALHYTALAATLLAAGYAGLLALTTVGVPLLAAKVVTDGCLLAVSYCAQRSVVFRDRAAGAAGARPGQRARRAQRERGTGDPDGRLCKPPMAREPGARAPGTRGR
jgi:putative flippase GtrA